MSARNGAQIENKIVADFKTKFFNRIGRLLPVALLISRLSERPLLEKGDVQIAISSDDQSA